MLRILKSRVFQIDCLRLVTIHNTLKNPFNAWNIKVFINDSYDVIAILSDGSLFIS